MKNRLFNALLLVLIANLTYARNKETRELKPRVIILTDISTWETDDSESLVRLLVYADILEIEGIVYTTGWSLDKTRDDFINLIHTTIDAYEKDLPLLMKRSGQTGHLKAEEKQYIGYWPSADYLRSKTVFGSKNRGLEFIGENNNSPGSELIINQADAKDKRPLWILLWGGGNTLAQSVWQIKNERSEKKLKSFLKKIHVYAITDQDRDQNTPFEISSHQWLREKFENNLFFIWDENAWMYQNGTGRTRWSDYESCILKHGNLGDAYPKYKYGVEGDTPSFLHVLPNGLNNPTKPGHGGWGGYFEWSIGPDNKTSAFNNNEGNAKIISYKYSEYFYQAIFNDFAARMDWVKDGIGNRNPLVVINKNQGNNIIEIKTKSGATLSFDASDSYDPDGDKINYSWRSMPQNGDESDDSIIDNKNSDKINVRIPDNYAGKSIHLICEVSDEGVPSLTAYRRIILNITK